MLCGNHGNLCLFQSRVIHQQTGERNFHSFYQLLSGAKDEKLAELKLSRDPTQYYFINQGGDPKVKHKS